MFFDLIGIQYQYEHEKSVQVFQTYIPDFVLDLAPRLPADCRREVNSCRRAGPNPSLTPAERLGAMQSEVDWLVELNMVEEERAQSEMVN